MLEGLKTVIIHNIISPYKTLLFNELYQIYNGFKVLYITETESNREWNIKRDELKFPYEIVFKGTLDSVSLLKSVIITWEKLNSINPDVLILGGYSYIACWVAFFWAKLNKKKIILWSASNKEDRYRLFIKEIFKSYFVKRCDAADVYGKRSKDYLAKLGMMEDRIFIKGNTADNNFYYNETIKLKVERKHLCKQFGIQFNNFLYIGRFSQEKNLLSLLNAYRRLGVDNWGLILVGSGPQMKEIDDYVKKYSIRNILMPGFKQKEEIPQFLAVSDVFILPSVSETWGLVVNEAMAARFPVLVSRMCGCYPDLIKEGVNGFSFDPFNIEELYELMKNVVEGRYNLEAMGRSSLDIIRDYTPAKAAEVIKETIENVLKRKI